MKQLDMFEKVLKNYPETAPYVPGSETSKAAAERIEPQLGKLQKCVLHYLQGVGPATDEQMQITLMMNPSTQRPRRIELVNKGLVRALKIPLGGKVKRMTRSGGWAQVWEAV